MRRWIVFDKADLDADGERNFEFVEAESAEDAAKVVAQTQYEKFDEVEFYVFPFEACEHYRMTARMEWGAELLPSIGIPLREGGRGR